MERIEWESEADEFFRNYELERQLSMVRIPGNRRQRSAIEIWKWLAFLVKKINGFIQYFKLCDSVSIVNAWRPLRPGRKNPDFQRRKTRPCGPGLETTKGLVESDLSCASEEEEGITPSSATSKSSKLLTPRQGKGWVKRLIIRGVNGKGANKRRIEVEGDGRRARLTRKRRRIARSSPMKKQQQNEARESAGFRAFLRPEELRHPSGVGEASLDPTAKRSPDGAIPTVSGNHLEAFLIDISDDDNGDGMARDNDTEEAVRYRPHHDDRRNPSPAPAPVDESVVQQLPEELVDRVLGRLPLTSVLRFRSVCRRWQSRLSPEGWCRIFQQVSPPTWTACPALFTSGNGRRQCAFYDLSLHKWSRIFLDFLPDPACHLLAASGGLLCLCYSGMNSSLFICNPLTKSWRALPSFNHTRRRAGSMIVHMLVQPTTGAYKVILIGHPTCMTASPPSTTEVFDSETGSWTALANVPSDGCTLSPSVVLRNGILYCLTELPTGLLAFNLARKVWRRLEIKSHFRVLSIFEHRSHILLVARTSARVTRIGIWKLRESFSRVWLKVAIMPAEHAAYFLKSGRFQCFGHDNFICFASPRRPQWLLFDLGKRLWSWGSPARGLDQDSYNRWFFYEPRLDIQA